MSMNNVMVIALCVFSVVSLIAYGFDKVQAKRGGRRIREKCLLFCSFLGPIGSIIGMVLFHHKVAKSAYLIRYIPTVFISLIVWGYILYVVFGGHFSSYN